MKVTFLGTGAGMSIHRIHTAIALEWSGGPRLLLDAASGNSVMRQGAQVGLFAQDFEQVLLSHHHADHMAGLPHIQGQRTQADPEGLPLQVFSTEEALAGVQRLFRATSITHKVDQDGVETASGRQVACWRPAGPGQVIDLGNGIRAEPFEVQHIGGAVGWRVECDGLSVVFSGDTTFSESLAEASQGAHLLIHEALGTEQDREGVVRRAHSTAAEAGRAAALAGVGQLVLTHIDSAYHFNSQPLADEAREHFQGPVTVASDLYQLTIERE